MTRPLAGIVGGYEPLYSSFPDLERRDFIFMSGPRWGDNKTGDWVFSSAILHFANYASGKPVFMRYHEYWQVEDGIVTAIEGLWDIPQIMIIGVWPFGQINQPFTLWMLHSFLAENANISVKLDEMCSWQMADAKDRTFRFVHCIPVWFVPVLDHQRSVTQTVLSWFPSLMILAVTSMVCSSMITAQWFPKIQVMGF